MREFDAPVGGSFGVAGREVAERFEPAEAEFDDDALREASDAVRLEPGNPDWYETLAGIHVAKGEPRKAVSILEQLTKEVPGEPLYRRLLASALDMYSVSMWTDLPDRDGR